MQRQERKRLSSPTASKQHKTTDRGMDRSALRNYSTPSERSWEREENIAIILNSSLIEKTRHHKVQSRII